MGRFFLLLLCSHSIFFGMERSPQVPKIQKLSEHVCEYILNKQPDMLESPLFAKAPEEVREMIARKQEDIIYQVLAPVTLAPLNNTSLTYKGVCAVEPITHKKQILSLGCNGEITFCCEKDLSECEKYTIDIKPWSSTLHSDELSLIIGSSYGQLMKFDTQKKEIVYEVKAHQRAVNSVTLSADENSIISTGNDTLVKIWDARSGQFQALLKGHDITTKDAYIMHDNQAAVSGAFNRVVKIWDLKREQEISTIIVSGETSKEKDTLSAMKQMNHVGNLFCCTTSDHCLRMYDIRTGKKEIECETCSPNIVSRMITDKENFVVLGSWDGSLKLWDLRAVKIVAYLKGHTDWIQSINAYQSFHKIVSGSRDLTVKIWDASTFVEVSRNVRNYSRPMNLCAAMARFTQAISEKKEIAQNDPAQVWTNLNTIIAARVVAKQPSRIALNTDALQALAL